MRLHILLPFSLLAAPLAAQQRPIAPAASVLFRAAPLEPVQDTVKVDDGIPQNEGAFLGMVGGAVVGYLFIRATEGGPGICSFGAGDPCDPPQDGSTENRVIGAVIFGVAGAFVGGALAGPHVPKVKRPKPPPPPAVPRPPNVDRGMTRRQGAKIGGLAGGVAGVALAARFGWKIDADAGGVDPISLAMYGAVGALLGMLVGGGMAGTR